MIEYFGISVTLRDDDDDATTAAAVPGAATGGLGVAQEFAWGRISSETAQRLAFMEVVSRRKGFLVKDNHESLIEVEVGTGSQSVSCKSCIWTFCLLVACVYTFSVGLRSENLSTPYAPISSGYLGISIPDSAPSIYVQDAVLFPDNVMLLVRVSTYLNLEGNIDSLECRFGFDSVNKTRSPVVSIKRRTKDLQIVRCSRPEENYFPSRQHSNVSLGIRNSDVRVETNAVYHPHALPSWEALVYENLIDGDTIILLAKGLVSKSSRKMETWSLKCVFGTDLPSEIVYETSVLTAAQEVIRCEKPGAHLDNKLRGHRVSIKASWLSVLPSTTYYDPDNEPKTFLRSFLRGHARGTARDLSAQGSSNVPTLRGDLEMEGDGQVIVKEGATILESSPEASSFASEENLYDDATPRRKLCACTMVWNKAKFIREWVLFHSFMGVEKYFFYDNDSDDDTEEILDSLAAYNVSRIVWPWMKTQQAAFSHCTVLARDQCEWVLFTDVDEYIYPYFYLKKSPDEGSDALVYHRMIDAETDHALERGENLGQIQFECNNFGPSGLNSTPAQGVTVGYTCRMRIPERHKSIIMLDAIDNSLLNVLHHFDLRDGYHSFKMHRKVAVCNHYKFQAWDAFRMKFVRRAGTYTIDWQKNASRGSNDRTPGLGTKAVKPLDWESQFCQVLDTGLRDFSLRTFSVANQPDKMVWQL